MYRLEIKSPAKLNLYLQVIKKRKDGYHELITLFERIDLFDRIVLEKARKIELLVYGREVPRGKDNLAYRSAEFLSQKLGKTLGVRMKIFKKIPPGGGLGGGSSNAASVLLGLNQLYELGLRREELFSLGKDLGADVNFFLSGENFALGYGRGERISRLEIKTRLWHLLIYPGFSISTREIYAGISEIGLTKGAPDVKILIEYLEKRDLEKAGKLFFNSLEPVVWKKYPFLYSWKKKLLKTPAKAVLLSGSGSSIFALYPRRKEVEEIEREWKKIKGGGELFIVSTDCSASE
ncbi:MAG: 4-(cytidine 5'-diphospho)-2-C-methyl-D-erythritol kinase [Candidatus Omnitrophica bacterium]|nr:4-(cytidine 5'-diphospho)-2-C-methyl-D-erythritol kinase [Candidatus Omnitrophota bacterium]MCM8798206.1 4-(cytidine 5'-diphospho)-2-C-methyl-D-erythritol kinase [Candidatus Omnitrophota bacterium]